jgi:hypothetical protein
MYVDLYLCQKREDAENLALLGCSALYLAMKMDEVELRRVSEFARMAGREYSSEDIGRKERDIVNALKFRLLPDTLFFWVDLVMKSWDDFSVAFLQPVDHRLFKRPDPAN